MSLFRILWLRRFIRKNTNPIPIDRAEAWRKRLSFMYMLIGWNAFGFVCYMCFTGKKDWAKYYGVISEDEAKMPAGNYTNQFITPICIIYYIFVRAIVGKNFGNKQS